MAQEQQEQAAAERLARLAERIQHWRRLRPKQRAMPVALWDEAVCLSRGLGVHRVKAALGLNYESLKQRLALADQAATEPGAAPPATRFVELSGVELLGPAAHAPVVELSDAEGTRLTMRLVPGSEIDVARLVEAFVRRRR
jgi:hypothetical protein